MSDPLINVIRAQIFPMSDPLINVIRAQIFPMSDPLINVIRDGFYYSHPTVTMSNQIQ